MSGAELIAAERQRQIESEGWTLEHDSTVHFASQLALAALLYAMPPWLRDGWPSLVRLWTPWREPLKFKSATRAGSTYAFVDNQERIRELAKAGALLAAEIDRLQYEVAA